ncbi:S41 family peptidase [Planctomycetota bacterium]|nr:S41 family peptidase [Planctomycetota bacterium]
MKRILVFAAAALLFGACSNKTDSATRAETDDRSQFDTALLQKDGAGAEAARKASRKELEDQLNILIPKLKVTTTLQEAFRVGEAIQDLGKDAGPMLQKRLVFLENNAKIAGARALWHLDVWDPAINELLTLAIGVNSVDAEGNQTISTPVEVRVAAAEVLGALASIRHEKMLRTALKESIFQPEVKIQLAVALWRSAKDVEATRILREMLKSDNDTFKIAAALALGEINQLTNDAKEVLEIIAEEPTLRGRTARRSLEYERAIQRFEAAIENRLPGQPKVGRIDTKLLDALEEMIKARYIYPDAIAGRKLLYAAANGMLNGMDPYSVLLEDGQLRHAAEIKRFSVPTLGLNLGSKKLNEDSNVRLMQVLSVVPGGPADKAGLRSGDRIYRVLRNVTADRVHEIRKDSSDLPNEKVSLQSLPLDESIVQFQGVPGTQFGLQVMREDWLLTRWIHIQHAEFETEAVTHEMLPANLGLIRVNELSASSSAKVAAAVKELSDGGAKALILDLRNSAGGSAEAAAKVAGEFLPKDTLVTYSMGRSIKLAPSKEYRTTTETQTKLPLTVIVNGGTCDGAEILAGALKDYGRAILAGSNTFGRSIVQELIALQSEELKEDKKQASLLLTVARYYSPKSELAFYDRGVAPDIELKAHLFEGWIYDELEAATESADFEAYMTKLLTGESATLAALANADGRDAAKYDGLAKLHEKLGLHTEVEELRYLVRHTLRERLKANGVKIYKTDLQEDTVFGQALKAAAESAKIDLSGIPEYESLK